MNDYVQECIFQLPQSYDPIWLIQELRSLSESEDVYKLMIGCFSSFESVVLICCVFTTRALFLFSFMFLTKLR